MAQAEAGRIVRFSESHPTARYPRSFIDLPTNSGLIGSLLTGNDVAKFAAGRLPKLALPSVLHEATHHWCFSGALGVALALLFHRSGARMEQFALATHGLHPHDAQDYRDALRDALRYEAAVCLLEPLFEGLALFCEFDVRAHSRDVLPEPLTHTATLFDRPTGTPAGPEALIARIEEVLREMRSNEEMIGRKQQVLLGSLQPSTNPYLGGYLAIKWTWAAAAGLRDEFASADVFFAFIRHYLFCDMELVDLLLSADEERFNAAFATRIRDRLLALRRSTTYASIGRGEAFLSALDGFAWSLKDFPAHHLIAIDAQCARRGLVALRAAYDQLTERAHTENAARAAWSAALAALETRDAFVLDCMEVKVRVKEDGRMAVHAGPEMDRLFAAGMSLTERVRNVEGIGHAVMLVSRAVGMPYFAICFDREVINESVTGQVTEEERAWLRELAAGIVHKQMLSEAWQRRTAEVSAQIRQWRIDGGVLDAGDVAAALRPPLHENVGLGEALARTVDTLYGPLALPPFLPQERHASALQRLGRHGIAEFFPKGTLKFLPVVIGWSLEGASKRHLNAFLETMEEDATLGEVIDLVNARAQECWGADLIVMGDGEIHTIAV